MKKNGGKKRKAREEYPEKKVEPPQNDFDENDLDVNDEEDGNYGAFIDQIASLEGSKRFIHDKDEDEDFDYRPSSEGTSVTSLLGAVKDKDLKKTLKKSVKKVDKFKSLKLSEPLSNPEANRASRAAAYSRTRKDLAQWDAVVSSRRVAPTLNFPLETPNVKFVTSSEHFASKFEAKTPLEKEVMALLESSDAVVKPGEELSVREKSLLDKMTLKEAFEKRRELMKLKRLQSFQEKKIRMQNKIKSKKYRRILRKEKQKNKIKELELLHATNPELAAEKMEEMEKIRIQERASLKHRNASKYLQFQAVRSKHNKESQEIVQEQLRKHRELTTKLGKTVVDSEDEEEVPCVSENTIAKTHNSDLDASNPWITKKSSKVEKSTNIEEETFDEFSANYKKFWTQENEKKLIKGKDSIVKKRSRDEDFEIDKSDNKKRREDFISINEDETSRSTEVPKESKNETMNAESSEKNKTLQTKKGKKKRLQEGDQSNSNSSLVVSKKAKKAILEKEKLEMAETIDDLFCEAGNIMKNKIEKRLKKMKGEKNSDDEDEENDEEIKEDDDGLAHAESLNFKSELEYKAPEVVEQKTSKNIDPKKFIEIKPKKPVEVTSEEQDGILDDDDDEEEGVRKVIAEVFADDDVIEKDFKSEKDAIIQANKPKDTDLFLPGWGDWGGIGLKESKRKRRRFLIKAPPAPVRKDANKGHLIINEDKNTAITKHQVSAVPFPFNSVADYEASIRTPIGDTFVPRAVFKKLTAPKVRTRSGIVIEPMSREELVKRGLVQEDLKVNS